MKRVINASWMACYKQFEAILDKYWDENSSDTNAISRRVDEAVVELYNKHKGDPEWDEAYNRWAEDSGLEDRDLHVNKPLKGEDYGYGDILYVIKDRHGNQISMPTPDDEELWDRVLRMENRGERGLSVVVYTGDKR